MTRPRLRDFRGETIDMACRRCDRHGVYDRKALVKRFGARIEFMEISRRLAIGFDLYGTDRCEATFPWLLQASILIERATTMSDDVATYSRCGAAWSDYLIAPVDRSRMRNVSVAEKGPAGDVRHLNIFI